MASVYHEVQAKELKAVLPPHGIQLVQHRTKSMSGTCSHLRYQIILNTELYNTK
jgi:hypothetical protein